MRPHLSDCNAEDSVVNADKVYTIGKRLAAGRKRLDASTRLIHCDGLLYDLRDERNTGDGRTRCVGARVATRRVPGRDAAVDYGGAAGNPHLEGQGYYQLHYIDTPGVLDPVSGKKLGHVLMYVGLRFDDGGLTARVDAFYRLLTEAAERWSPGSPGVIGPTKDYRIESKEGARDTVLRLRAYFGEVRAWPRC